MSRASSGLGEELARVYYQNGFNIVLVAKQESRLQRLKQSLLAAPSVPRIHKDGGDRGAPVSRTGKRDVIVLPCDLRNPRQLIRLAKELSKRNLKVDVLVNNAGECHRSSFAELPWIKMRSLLDLNVQSNALLTRLLLPSMMKRFKEEGRPGRVVIVSSIAGMVPTADVALYAASKAFLTSFAKSLRKECTARGVAVTCAMPGAIRDTRFAADAQVEDAVIFQVFGMAQSAADVAQDIYRSSVHGKNQVVSGYLNKLYAHGMVRLLPEALASKVAGLCWHPVPKWLSAAFYRSQVSLTAIAPTTHNLGHLKAAATPETAEVDYISQLSFGYGNAYDEYSDGGNVPMNSCGLASHHFGPSDAGPTVIPTSDANVFNITAARRELSSWLMRRWDEPLIDYRRVQTWFGTMRKRLGLVVPPLPRPGSKVTSKDQGSYGRAEAHDPWRHRELEEEDLASDHQQGVDAFSAAHRREEEDDLSGALAGSMFEEEDQLYEEQIGHDQSYPSHDEPVPVPDTPEASTEPDPAPTEETEGAGAGDPSSAMDSPYASREDDDESYDDPADNYDNNTYYEEEEPDYD